MCTLFFLCLQSLFNECTSLTNVVWYQKYYRAPYFDRNFCFYILEENMKLMKMKKYNFFNFLHILEKLILSSQSTTIKLLGFFDFLNYISPLRCKILLYCTQVFLILFYELSSSISKYIRFIIFQRITIIQRQIYTTPLTQFQTYQILWKIVTNHN